MLLLTNTDEQIRQTDRQTETDISDRVSVSLNMQQHDYINDLPNLDTGCEYLHLTPARVALMEINDIKHTICSC